MDTASAFSLLDIIVVGAGLYMLYAYYILMTKNELKEGVLVSKNMGSKKCKDIEGYKKFMGIPILVTALMAIVSGGIGLYQNYVARVPALLYWTFYFCFIAVLVWFVVCTKKAEKRFF